MAGQVIRWWELRPLHCNGVLDRGGSHRRDGMADDKGNPVG